jgi:murein L,D-transpeptidase YcbB/YkuD
MEIARIFETPAPYTSRTLQESDIAAFLREHPEYAVDSADISAFYERRDMQYAWILGDSLSSSAESFIALVGVSDTLGAHASGPDPHLGAVYEAIADGGVALCAACARDVELRLTAEFFRFARRNFGGHLSRDPRELNWFIPRARKDYARLIDSLAAGNMDLDAYLPMHPQYHKLRPFIERYARIDNEAWVRLTMPPKRRTIAAGDSLPLVSAIRTRLALLGDVAESDSSERYDSAMVAGVQQFQTRHGLAADGVIGPAVLSALNIAPSERLRTMLINIERLRWVSERQPPNLLYVNIPEFRLHVMEDGREVMNMEVVVGTSATRTIVFSDTVTQLVFSPSWTVPASITKNEILPAMEKDPDYLRRHDMEIIGGSRTAPIVRQRPGPSNPLGGVKFLFPNAYDIYMHDSPARALFEREKRTFSHGCIRVSQAAELAQYLLRHERDWTPQRIADAMTSGRESYVRLAEPVPVTIGYFTAWVDDGGLLNFRDDVYGHDAKLARELFSAP